MSVPSGAISSTIGRFAAGLRFPVLFAITATVFVIDLLIPDLVPFVDEVLLGLFTLLLGGLKRRAGTDAAEGGPRES